LLFASEGAHVVLADINLTAAEKVATAISHNHGQEGVKAIAVKCDVGSESDVQALVDKAVAEFGRLDIMVRLGSLTAAH
jgi:NAD(P)-dependent dehydrogenase (short-subunit alcohol dehydrogenase family)